MPHLIRFLVHIGSSISAVKKPLNIRLSRYFSLSKSNRMRFTQFALNGEQNLGILRNDNEIVNLSHENSLIPNSLVEYLYRHEELNHRLLRIVEEAKYVCKLNQVKLLAPITKMDKVICVGLNYKGHCDEQNKPYPEIPFFFNKFPSTIIGPGDELPHPANSKAVDWEVEMTVVVSKKARNIPIEKAYEYVFGYTIAQDISFRDWQTPKRNNGQWLVAKSMEKSCPLGPVIVTKEDIPDPHRLNISCSINGVLKQNANTNELIHRVDKLVSYLSELFTLLPGDIILTGTPSGVGVFRNPREFLKPGDVIVSELSSVGKLETKVIDSIHNQTST